MHWKTLHDKLAVQWSANRDLETSTLMDKVSVHLLFLVTLLPFFLLCLGKTLLHLKHKTVIFAKLREKIDILSCLYSREATGLCTLSLVFFFWMRYFIPSLHTETLHTDLDEFYSFVRCENSQYVT